MIKKIFHLINSLDNGGCEKMLLRTLPLVTGYEHQIYTLKQKGILADKFEQLGISVSQVKGLLELRNIVKSESPDIIVTYLFHADVVGRLLFHPRRTTHVISFLRTTYNYPRYLPARIFELLTSFLSEHYFANSIAVKNYYVNNLHVPQGKISVIPNGVDLKLYSKSEKLRNEYRNKLKLGQQDVVLIDVANFHPNKGHKHLIKAFSQIKQSISNAKLLLVGEGVERPRIQSLASKTNHADSIHFLGNRNDIPELLNCSDIYVSPTYFEGMSNSLMEAMAIGLPVVTTAIPENALLIKNGFNGLLIPMDDRLDISLSQGLISLIKNPKGKDWLGTNARKTILETYSLKKVAKLWLKELAVYA